MVFELTLEKLFGMEYKVAYKRIKGMQVGIRLEWAKEVEDTILPNLYKATELYYDKPFPKEDEIIMKPKEFIQLMNRIKHWEQLIEWFYEVELGWLFRMIEEEDETVREKTGAELLADAIETYEMSKGVK